MEQEKIFKEIKGIENVWNAQEQREIEGTLVREEMGTYGKNFVIKTASDKEFLVFGSTVLSSKLASIETGKYIKITYLGEVKSKESGRNYKDFKVEIAE